MATTRSPREETRDRQRPGEASLPPSEHAKVVARKDRVPLGVPRTKLTTPQRPGYVRRWINDDDKGRLQNAQQGGYTFVEDPALRVGEDGGGDRPDSRVSRIVGRAESGKPLRAFLMEIPSEQYQEDQASKQSELDEVDRAIKKGSLVSQGEESRYVPERGIRVESELKKSQRPGEDDAD
jgi:hypothetical protein